MKPLAIAAGVLALWYGATLIPGVVDHRPSVCGELARQRASGQYDVNDLTSGAYRASGPGC